MENKPESPKIPFTDRPIFNLLASSAFLCAAALSAGLTERAIEAVPPNEAGVVIGTLATFAFTAAGVIAWKDFHEARDKLRA